ncbi:MAG: hypothetical protein ACK4P2_09415 [Hyphomonas sp.]
MFGKRKCDAPPAFPAPLHAESADGERAALARLECKSGVALTPGAIRPPSAAALVKAAQLPDAIWLHANTVDCSRCKKSCDVQVSHPATGPAPNAMAVRSKARPDFYALQHAFLPEWFLTKPEALISLLTNKLDSWQAQTMTQIAGVVERSPGAPMPIRDVQVVGTPGDTTSVLIDFLAPCSPVEAHFALLVGGPRPFYLLSEKTHLGEDKPLTDMAGLSEWAFTNAERTDMKHTAIELLPDVSRTAFFTAAVALLKRRLA